MKEPMSSLYSKLRGINRKQTILRVFVVLLIFSIFVPTVNATVPFEPFLEDEITAPDDTNAAASNSIYGLEETPVEVDEQEENGLDQFNNTGTKWVRGPVIVWSDIEATKGVRDWDEMDDAVVELQQIFNLGYTPIVVVRGSPVWAQIDGGSSCSPMKPEFYDDFAVFIIDALEELSDRLPSGNDVQFIEIWNEPDVDPEGLPADAWYAGCWGDKNDTYYGGTRYSKMLSVVYNHIKNEDPSKQVLTGGLNLFCNPYNPPPDADCTPGKFLEGILFDAGGNNFDGVSFHAYDYYGGSYGLYGSDAWMSYWDTTGPTTIAKAGYIRALLKAFGVTGKYLMNTENALICFQDCPETPGSDESLEATKANYLAEAYASAIATGLAANVWYDILGSWIDDAGPRNNGLISYVDLDPLPAKDAYEFSSNQLNGATLVRVISDYEIDDDTDKPVGIFGYEFNTPYNYHVWMVRSIDGSNQVLSLPWAPIAVYDVYGDNLYPGQTPPTDINLTVEPVYIRMTSAVPRLALPLIIKGFQSFSNGDFENGAAHWSPVNSGLPASLVTDSPTSPITGNEDTYIPDGDFAAQLGDLGYGCGSSGVPIGYAATRQLFTIPYASGYPDTGEVWLEFKYIMYTQDGYNTPDFDRFEVYVQDIYSSVPDLLFYDRNNSTGDLSCSIWRRIPGAENPRDGTTVGWATGMIDLTEYQGMMVVVSFENHNRVDGYYNTITYIDNIELLLNP